MTASYIYFIQANGDGPIKVGTTRHDPRRRMVKIQSDCPWPVHLIGAIEGSVAQEKQIHLVLARWRTQGEWFEPTPIVLAAVNEALTFGKKIEIPVAERDDEIADHPLRRWRQVQGLTQDQLGALLGADKMSVSRWECGLALPHRRKWEILRGVTGITAGELARHVVLAEAVQ